MPPDSESNLNKSVNEAENQEETISENKETSPSIQEEQKEEIKDEGSVAEGEDASKPADEAPDENQKEAEEVVELVEEVPPVTVEESDEKKDKKKKKGSESKKGGKKEKKGKAKDEKKEEVTDEPKETHEEKSEVELEKVAEDAEKEPPEVVESESGKKESKKDKKKKKGGKGKGEEEESGKKKKKKEKSHDLESGEEASGVDLTKKKKSKSKDIVEEGISEVDKEAAEDKVEETEPPEVGKKKGGKSKKKPKEGGSSEADVGKKKKGKSKQKGEVSEKKSKSKKSVSSIKLDKSKSLISQTGSKIRTHSQGSELVSKSSLGIKQKSVLFEDKTSPLLDFDDESTSATDSEDVDEEIPVEIEKSVELIETKPKKTKKGKGKKGKKGKASKKEATELEAVKEEEIPQVDLLAEIQHLKEVAAAPADQDQAEEPSPKKKKKGKGKKGTVTEDESVVTEGTEPSKKKKGPKKKLSKKEKARLAAEAAEKAKVNAEEEAARAAELERIRLEEERKAAIEKDKREAFEQQIRLEQLENSAQKFKELVAYNKELRAKAKAQAEWEFYVGCGRLPNPSKCDQMNTFLHLWENMIQETTMEEAARRTVDVLELLDELDDLIDTAEDKNTQLVENWKWVRLLFRQQQAKSLDVATYKLLRNIEKNLNRIDIPTANYTYQDANIALCLWLRVQLPTPLPNPRRPPKPRIEVTFPEMKLEVQFPPSVDGEKVAVRGLYVKYDHLSDLSETYDKPDAIEPYDFDLCGATKKEWREKMLYKYYNRVRKPPDPPPEGEEPVEEPEDIIGPDEDVPVVPYRKLEPSASEHVIAEEDTSYSNARSQLIKDVSDDIINLRKYSIIGGVYYLNLIHQPPQPQDFVTLEMNLTPLYLPKQLELVDLYIDYNPPVPPDPLVRRQPEEIEEEMKKLDEELEKLVLVTLTWPDHVIFLELPMVCYWDEDNRVWSKSEVHDLKHNEEKGQLTFRTRKGATFALAVYRYANLPYQAWEMRPEVDGSISFQITAAILMVEFNIKGGLIALTQLQNSPNNALQDIIGTYYKLPKLIRILQNAAVDVFPAFDAFCYIENTCEKHWPMEKQLYYNMAQLCICFNFAWSRWNMAAGRRSIILQMREYNLEKTKQKNHLMLHVTPLNALYVDCTEVSQTFNEEGIENMKFYPDLYHLMKGTCNMTLKNKLSNAPKDLVYAVYELLIATRVASFS